MGKLNVFKSGCYKRWRYPSSWGYNIKTFFRTFKMAYQRTTRGFCDWDWYDLDSFYAKVIAGSLRALGENTISHPLEVEFEEWKTNLLRLASQFDKIAEDPDALNPYAEEFDTHWKEYQNWEFNAYKEREQLIKDSFAELAEIYNDLWD